MKDEIKEILYELNDMFQLSELEQQVKDIEKIFDYITNLQEQLHQASLDIQELTEKDIGCPSWCDKLTNLQEENERLKQSILNAIDKMNSEMVIINDRGYYYTDISALEDILQINDKDFIDYKSRNEKAQDLILNELSHLKANDEETWNKEFYDENNKLDYRKLCIELLNQVINLLNGGDENE